MENQLIKFMEYSTMEGDKDSNVTCTKLCETPIKLQLAVKGGQIREVDSILRRNANSDINRNHEDHVNARDKDGMTPLLVASLNGYVEIAEILLEYGASIDSASTSGFDVGSTPLRLAVKNCHHELAQLLLKKGANVNANGGIEKSTPLHIAIKHEDARMVRRLLKYGANVDAKNLYGQTALCLAVEISHGTIVELILESRPDVHDEANRGCVQTAIGRFQKTGIHIFEDLMKFGFTVSSEEVNEKMLYDLVEYGFSPIVLNLLRYDIDISTYEKICNDSICSRREYRGYTFFGHVVKNRCHELARLLINYGFNPNAKDARGRSVFAYAVMNADVKMINTLLCGEFRINDSADLLRIAVQIKSTEMVKWLLQYDPTMDINASDEKGRTALHFTALFRDGDLKIALDHDCKYMHDAETEIAILLLSNGAHVNATLQYKYDCKEGELVSSVTTLHIAVDQCNGNLVETLLMYNANVNSMDAIGQTPLHIASIQRHDWIMETLFLYDCDINVVNKIEQTPLQLAINVVNKIDQTPLELDINTNTLSIFLDRMLHCIFRIMALGQYVSDRNLHCIDFNDNDLKYIEKCKEEVEKMTKKGAHLLIPYSPALSYSWFLALGNMKKRFPLYSKIINHTIDNGITLIVGAKSFYSLCPYVLPHFIVRKVLNYLSQNDLMNLMRATHESNNN